jgi:hypothetical protein
MKLVRSISATVARPGNGAEAAFAAGYKGLQNSYVRKFPDAYKAGKKAAQEAHKNAEAERQPEMELVRSISATVARPGNGKEAAFAAGYKGLQDSYVRHHPGAYKAGKKAAQEAQENAEAEKQPE